MFKTSSFDNLSPICLHYKKGDVNYSLSSSMFKSTDHVIHWQHPSVECVIVCVCVSALPGSCELLSSGICGLLSAELRAIPQHTSQRLLSIAFTSSDPQLADSCYSPTSAVFLGYTRHPKQTLFRGLIFCWSECVCCARLLGVCSAAFGSILTSSLWWDREHRTYLEFPIIHYVCDLWKFAP